MSFNLTRLESAQVFKLRVLFTLCKCRLCGFLYIYIVVHLLQKLKIQSHWRESEKNYTLLFNPVKSDAHLNNMRVQNFSTLLTENTVHFHYKHHMISVVYENMRIYYELRTNQIRCNNM